ncbi:hypothetical protein FZC76_05800 [Sutcliffiella horikoshii]|uniref:Uncharacterized protein n=1 Tax=Sutcliffiella horikoshii TaxID=79883 RepID=A0A5D4T506_9BACI|nr:DUF5677 domain-containing protein [Sutcliffiella horikoshii]TYS69748.1 hypothetical protein FZC76_05800 [Sutcliffiella horikoshii]
MSKGQYTANLDKLINKFILRSRDFVEYAAHLFGYTEMLMTGEKNSKFTYDHEYFNFTKSTKTLISIRLLLKMGHNEDALILIRSMFENYLSSRYLNENGEFIDQLITFPLNVFFNEYNVRKGGEIFNRDGQKVGDQINPSEFKTGKDKQYYYTFYGFLSPFAHSNFGIVNFYLDKNLCFTVEKENYPLLVRFFTVFVFTKIFEHIVTVEGEEFINERTEKECYKLVEESIKFQYELIPVLIAAFNSDDTKVKHYNKRMREMLKDMRKSLKEELGSVKKDFLN